jgi:Domain of unknown function (DUF4221)
MKKLILILLTPLIFSCGGNSSENPESGNVLANLTYTVDTVLVDSGEEIFVLSYGLGAKALNQDKSILMFFENEPLSLVQVDLNNLKLIRKTPFQKEGPNGVGDYVIGLQPGPNSEVFIKSYNSQAVFNMEGKLTKSLKVVPKGIDPELANNPISLYDRAVFDFKKNRIHSQPPSEILKKNELFIIDLNTQEVRIEPIPEVEAVKEFAATFIKESGESTMINFFGVDSYMYLENDQLLIAAGAMSGIYRLEPQTDSLTFIPILHQNFPNRMNVKVNNLPTDEAQFIEDRRKVSEHLNYMEPLWDETREMYLRLGKRTFLGEKQSDPSTYEVFLFAYDKDFNVLGETKVDGLDQVPANYFWKDGNLWSYVNVEDELGFAVMDFKF